MNETSKTKNGIKQTLDTIAAALNAKLTLKHHPRAEMNQPNRLTWTLSPLDDKRIEINIIFTDYAHDGGPRLHLESAMGSNRRTFKDLSPKNLKKILLARVSERRAHYAEIELDSAKNDAANKAEKAMVKTLKAALTGFTHSLDDGDDNVWSPISNPLNTFKLDFTDTEGLPGRFTFVYSFQYDVTVGEINLKGEFDAVTSAQIIRTITALNSI